MASPVGSLRVGFKAVGSLAVESLMIDYQKPEKK
jgi:hypothetical protein